jgi:predicted MFS family arabinose efflux permease
VFGLVALSHQIGSAVGSYAGGLVHDLSGTYTVFFVAGAALSGAAAFMSWRSRKRPPSARRRRPPERQAVSER